MKKTKILKIASKIFITLSFCIYFLLPSIAFCEKKVEDYLPTFEAEDSEQYKDQIDTVENLPNYDMPTTLSMIAKLLIGITGSLAMVGLIVSGTLYVTAHGNDQQMEKAKNILIYIVVGVVVIAASYAIILGISSLSFD